MSVLVGTERYIRIPVCSALTMAIHLDRRYSGNLHDSRKYLSSLLSLGQLAKWNASVEQQSLWHWILRLQNERTYSHHFALVTAILANPQPNTTCKQTLHRLPIESHCTLERARSHTNYTNKRPSTNLQLPTTRTMCVANLYQYTSVHDRYIVKTWCKTGMNRQVCPDLTTSVITVSAKCPSCQPGLDGG